MCIAWYRWHITSVCVTCIYIFFFRCMKQRSRYLFSCALSMKCQVCLLLPHRNRIYVRLRWMPVLDIKFMFFLRWRQITKWSEISYSGTFTWFWKFQLLLSLFLPQADTNNSKILGRSLSFVSSYLLFSFDKRQVLGTRPQPRDITCGERMPIGELFYCRKAYFVCFVFSFVFFFRRTLP